MENLKTLITATMEAVKHQSASVPVKEPNPAEIAQSAKLMIDNGYMPYHQKAFEELAKVRLQTNNGILLTGNAGTGKTHFFKCLYNNKYIKNTNEILKIYKSCKEINGLFWFDLLRVYEGRSWESDLIIDDLGQEPAMNDYGTKIEVLEALICHRYTDWQRGGALTHITTNLTGAELDKRYTRRVTDRLAEMCHIIKFDGQSLRTAKGRGI